MGYNQGACARKTSMNQKHSRIGSELWRGANDFLREHCIAEFNRRFTVPAAQRGTAFRSCRHRNLEMVFTQRYERTVDRDNTVRFNNLIMQIERAEWRRTPAACKVIIHQHLDTTLTLMIAGHRVGHYSAEGKLLTPLTKKQIKAVEKTFPRLARDSHARALLLAFSESYTCLCL